MTTLYFAWQDQRARRWFPVGRLVHHETEPPKYEFAYVQGARQAKALGGFMEIPGFPDFDEPYNAPTLFPAFHNRIMNLRRPDRPEYLEQLGIDIDEWNELAELSISGGHSHADGFEAFPEIVPDADGRFTSCFILHGLRHTSPDSIRRSESLKAGEPLELSFELNNPVATHAISVKTRDQYILGWLPRYLVDGLHRDNSWMVEEVEAKVAQVNSGPPLSHRLLVDFSGRLPKGFHPMRDLEQYQPIPRKTPRKVELHP